VAITLGQFF